MGNTDSKHSLLETWGAIAEQGVCSRTSSETEFSFNSTPFVKTVPFSTSKKPLGFNGRAITKEIQVDFKRKRQSNSVSSIAGGLTGGVYSSERSESSLEEEPKGVHTGGQRAALSTIPSVSFSSAEEPSSLPSRRGSISRRGSSNPDRLRDFGSGSSGTSAPSVLGRLRSSLGSRTSDNEP